MHYVRAQFVTRPARLHLFAQFYDVKHLPAHSYLSDPGFSATVYQKKLVLHIKGITQKRETRNLTPSPPSHTHKH